MSGNDVIHFGGESQPTMTTREIADLTGKQHRHVMRDTETMFAALEIDPEGYAQTWTHPQNGQQYREYALTKDLTITLVSGYDVKMRHRIVCRIAEIEQAGMIALPQDYPSALRALADESEKTKALQARIEQDAPKVAFAEQVEVAPDAISMGEAAKLSGTGRTRLSSLLKSKKWLTRHGEPYQDKIEAGLLDVKLSSYEHPRDGLKKRVTPLITGKGLPRVVQMVRDAGLAT